MFSDLSVVIPTSERPQCLSRCLENLIQNLKIPARNIYVCDGSKSQQQETLSVCEQFGCNYIHHVSPMDDSLPLASDFESRLIQGLRQVKTEFSTIVADDDLLVAAGLEDVLNFLRVNPDYTVGHGAYIAFFLDFFQEKLHFKHDYSELKAISAERSIHRLCDYLEAYQPIFYATYRTKTLLYAFEKMGTFVDQSDLTFREILPGCMILLHGKLYLSTSLYMAREILPNISSTHETVLDNLSRLDFSSRMDTYARYLAEELPEDKDAVRKIKATLFYYFVFALKRQDAKSAINTIEYEYVDNAPQETQEQRAANLRIVTRNAVQFTYPRGTRAVLSWISSKSGYPVKYYSLRQVMNIWFKT